MKRTIKAIMAKPAVAHLMRGNLRFGNRMGNQFAAAITYFSVLAMVPILMFAFSMLGMTLTTLRPEWMQTVSDALVQRLDSTAGAQVANLVTEYLRNWRAVGIIGLLSLFYAGSGWVGNLRGAIQAQWRPEFEYVPDKRNIVVATVENMVTLVLLLLGVFITFAFSTGGTSLTHVLSRQLDIADWPGGVLLLRLTTYVLTMASAWVLFMVLYVLLPDDHRITRAKMAGSVIGAVAFTVLQIGAGALIGVFQNNRAAALFGPVIVLMLFMNLFARITLLIAAWIATSRQPAVAFHYNEADEPLRGRSGTVTAEDHWATADQERAQKRAEQAVSVPASEMPSVVSTARPRRATPYRPRVVTLDDYPRPSKDRMVSEPVAARSVRAGMRAGWVAGAATGVGIGAGLAALVKGLGSLRQKSGRD
ncbi:YihY/virulence factor BrkB family protein [Propionibacteriaceae bacterium G1746]|uniref:YihY/virulence factor BrkB family protein n=1 Tax=Aestuariimicrobium sp. G57 TaxID=3418485 RepID=UPI003C13EBB3